MTKKLIQTNDKGGNVTKVYYDYDWQEYLVTLRGQPRATYHTDCRTDALDTARAMLSRANLWDKEHVYCT